MLGLPRVAGEQGNESTVAQTQRTAQGAFQLVSSRYEHASLSLTSNLAFSRWDEVFGGQVVAAAMIDRIALHPDVLALNASYRLRSKHLATLPSARADNLPDDTTD